MKKGTIYPTRPVKSWEKTREVRRKWFRDSWEVRQKGGVVVVSQNAISPLLAGLGLYARRLYAPGYGKAIRDISLLRDYHEAADVAGFPAGEMCSSIHHQIGEMLLGLATKNPWTGEKSPVDFILESGFCPSSDHLAQLGSELIGVPYFTIHVPQEGGEKAVDFVVAEMADAIDWMEKVTHKEFQDEPFTEGVKNLWDAGVLRAQAFVALQNVPAPLDYFTLRELIRAGVVYVGHSREAVENIQTVLDEVQERVQDGISAFGIENCRLTHEGEPIFYAERFLPDIAKQFGAVFVAGVVTYNYATWEVEDGHWKPEKMFCELGVRLDDRDSALKFLARWLLYRYAVFWRTRIREKMREYVCRAQDWRCDGAVLHFDIGCRHHAMGLPEIKRVLGDAGIAVHTYEASNSDPRDFVPSQVQEGFETFLEHRLGLERMDSAK